MHDFDRWLIEEYQRVMAVVSKDPAELARRLARRRLGVVRDPPRAWCLAVRASDTRITPMNAAIVPLHAVREGRREAHEVALDAGLLKELCQPVVVFPRTDWLDVAKRLGVHPESLRYAMRKGFFKIERVAGLDGRKGPPIPLLGAGPTLDPSSCSLRCGADPLWGAVWQWAAASVPEGLSQAVRREARMLPYRGAMRFRGWEWICPGCGRRARTMFYPLPRFTISKYLGSKYEADAVDGMPEPPGCFACLFCHRVKYFTRLDKNAWNYFVAHVTGGLVYGREIARPAWMGAAEVKRKRRMVEREDSPRRVKGREGRAAVLSGLVAGKTFAEISAELGVAWKTVSGRAERLYREHGVTSRLALVAKVGVRHLCEGGVDDAAVEAARAG